MFFILFQRGVRSLWYIIDKIEIKKLYSTMLMGNIYTKMTYLNRYVNSIELPSHKRGKVGAAEIGISCTLNFYETKFAPITNWGLFAILADHNPANTCFVKIARYKHEK